MLDKFWTYLSYLGIDTKEPEKQNSTKILCNQSNTLLMLTMFILLVYLAINSQVKGTSMSMGSFRILWVFLLAVLNLFLARVSYHRLSKYSLIYLTPIVLMVIPTFTGFVEEESFHYYPYIVIALSIIPQILIDPHTEKPVYLISLAFYFILLVFIDRILIFFTPEQFVIIERIETFYDMYKISQFATFGFINLAVYYLGKFNRQIIKDIGQKDSEIIQKSRQLSETTEALEKTRAKLIESEKLASIGIITTGIVNELRNPLTFIHSGVNILQDIQDKMGSLELNELRDYFENARRIIDSGLIHSSKIIDSIASFAYKGSVPKKMTDINELINNALLNMSSQLPKKISIIKDYKLNHAIKISPGKFQQSIQCILDNAIFALSNNDDRAKRELKITTKAIDIGGGVAMISIFNTGPQIPREVLHQIFDPFYSSKPIDQGSGLGLYIAQSFIKDDGGDISVTNLDNGVEFTINIPFKQKKEQAG